MGLNKKGYTTLSLFFVIFMGFGLLIILGMFIFGLDLVDESASQITGQLGNVSLNGTYQEIMQPAIITAKTTMPKIISMGVLLGTILSLLIVSFNIKRLGLSWMILDLGIIISAEIIAVTIRDSFVSFMNSSPQFLEIFRTDLAFASKFILNLPTLIPTIGILIMVATYFMTKEKEERQDESF